MQQRGVIPTTSYERINVTAASQAQVTSWLVTDASIQYSTDDNDQPFKGAGGPLLGLLSWPDTIDARDWLTAAGTRRRIMTVAAEQDNPYFSTNRNRNNSQTVRTNVNVGLTVRPVSWGSPRPDISSRTTPSSGRTWSASPACAARSASTRSR